MIFRHSVLLTVDNDAVLLTGEAKVNFYYIPASSLENKYVGTGAKHVRDVFSKCRIALFNRNWRNKFLNLCLFPFIIVFLDEKYQV